MLPRLIKNESRAIYFPKLPYTTAFWNKFSEYTQSDFLFGFDKETVEMAQKLMSNIAMKQCSNQLEKDWRQKEAKFFKLVADFLPKLPLNKVRNISVLITPFGSVSSFFFKRVGKKFDFKITVRQDFSAAQIAESILTLLIWIEHPTPNLSLWYQVEASVDFVLTHINLFPDYHPTVASLPEIPSNLVAESNDYLAKLGFPITPVMPPVRFTPTEKRITDGLINNKGKIVTYDQIGDWFWQENALDKFSLYSIAKVMEKIRKKIKDAGVYQELIYTVRGQGYVLYD